MAIAPNSLNPSARLELLAKLESLRFVPPLPLSQFLDEAKSHGITASGKLLERFEAADLFRPLFHVTFPRIRVKIERENGLIRDLGRLKRGEKWAGEVQLETVYPAFQYHSLADSIRAKHVRASDSKFRKPWRKYWVRREQRGSPFFSIFQLCTLQHRLASSSLHDNLIWYRDRDPTDYRSWRRFLRSRTNAARMMLDGLSLSSNPRFDTAFLCTVIASRYYFETQGDGRTITVSEFGPPNRSWNAYRQGWDAKSVLDLLGIDANSVRQHHGIALGAAEYMDPLLEWYDLVRLVSVDKKRKLKGEARFGQLLHSMEGMLRLFYRDLTSKVIHSPLRRFELRSSQGEVENPAEAQDSRRLVANAYHVNPQPRLYIFVEGDGEGQLVPDLISRLWGFKAQEHGIEVRVLGGVQGFEGKRSDLDGTLPRLIDELHHLQILSFVLLDNEGQKRDSLPRLRERLATNRSILHPERTVTRRELFLIWKTCFEFENLSDEEIGTGLTALAGSRAIFEPAEVRRLRSSHGQGNSTSIGKHFELRTGFALPKRELMSLVADVIVETKPKQRPIVRILDELLALAAVNHQPILRRTGERNQRSGFLGHPLEGSSSAEVEHRFRRLRAVTEESGCTTAPRESD